LISNLFSAFPLTIEKLVTFFSSYKPDAFNSTGLFGVVNIVPIVTFSSNVNSVSLISTKIGALSITFVTVKGTLI
jgi:hypothetical protein